MINNPGQRVALFGAAGAIGRSIAAALRAAGQPYRVVGRSRASLEETFGDDPLAQIVTWNPDDPASIRAAARGIDTLIYLVGVNYWQFELHPVLMQRTLEAAQAEGVARLLLIGTVYPYGHARANPVTEEHPREPHTYKGRMRKRQEDLLMQAHRAGHIQAAVLRLPDFFGPGVDKSYLHSAFVAGANGTGKANMIAPLDKPHQFVFVPDAGPVVARLAGEARAYGRIWHFAGSGITTQAQIIAEIEKQTGKPLPRRAFGKTLLRLAGLFNPMLREMVEMHYLMTDPVIMDDSALQVLLGPIHRTSYVQGVRLSLEAARRADANSGKMPATPQPGKA